MKAHNCYSYMSNDLNNSRDYDAVLGGQSPAPFDAAVLGGIQGVKWHLSSQVVNHRVSALSEALKYGKEGLGLLIQALSDPEILVQQTAYKLLKNRKEFEIKSLLKKYQQYFFPHTNGIYKSCYDTKGWQFLRFYSTRKVRTIIIFPSDGNYNLSTDQAAIDLMDRNLNGICNGTYNIDKNSIKLFTFNSCRQAYYWGEIEIYGNIIYLNSLSNATGYRGIKKYEFIEIPNMP